MPAHTLVNARASLDLGETWTLAAWGRNLTDKEYLVAAPKDFFGGYQETYGYPRFYGFSVTAQF